MHRFFACRWQGPLPSVSATLRAAALVLVPLVSLSAAPAGAAVTLDEMSLERWAQLGEADRYQMKIAEKYYLESNWKVASAEYEKFLSLYEKSPGAPMRNCSGAIARCNCASSTRPSRTAISR